MSTEEKISENVEAAEPTKPKRRFKLDKKHIQGFIAGILVAAIAFTGLYYGTEGRFFKGAVGPGLIHTVADFESLVIKSNIPVHVTFFVQYEGTDVSSIRFAEMVMRNELNHFMMNFIYVNATELPEVAHRYSIKAIPTCVIFNRGELVAKKEGYMTQRDFQLWLLSSYQSIAP